MVHDGGAWEWNSRGVAIERDEALELLVCLCFAGCSKMIQGNDCCCCIDGFVMLWFINLLLFEWCLQSKVVEVESTKGLLQQLLY